MLPHQTRLSRNRPGVSHGNRSRPSRVPGTRHAAAPAAATQRDQRPGEPSAAIRDHQARRAPPRSGVTPQAERTQILTERQWVYPWRTPAVPPPRDHSGCNACVAARYKRGIWTHGFLYSSWTFKLASRKLTCWLPSFCEYPSSGLPSRAGVPPMAYTVRSLSTHWAAGSGFLYSSWTFPLASRKLTCWLPSFCEYPSSGLPSGPVFRRHTWLGRCPPTGLPDPDSCTARGRSRWRQGN